MSLTTVIIFGAREPRDFRTIIAIVGYIPCKYIYIYFPSWCSVTTFFSSFLDVLEIYMFALRQLRQFENCKFPIKILVLDVAKGIPKREMGAAPRRRHRWLLALAPPEESEIPFSFFAFLFCFDFSLLGCFGFSFSFSLFFVLGVCFVFPFSFSFFLSMNNIFDYTNG